MFDPPTIDVEELRAGIDSGELIAVMTMSAEAFEAAHIPGSTHMTCVSEAEARFPANAPLVVYCTDPACRASRMAWDQLTDAGYTNVRHYRGGLSGWTEAGLPLAGTMADAGAGA